MKNFNEIELGETLATSAPNQNSLNTYSQISQMSDFSQVIDNLKTIDISDTSYSGASENLKKYYELITKYLKWREGEGQEPTSTEYAEIESLTISLSKFSLTSSDYMKLQSALLEIGNYLVKVLDTDLYGEDGVYTALEESVWNFEGELNSYMESFDSAYDRMEDGLVGKIFPVGSITEKFMSKDIVINMKQIRNTSGIYIQYEGTLPDEVKELKPIVLKVK